MKRLSIRWRLTLWYGFGLSITLVVFGLSVLIVMRQHLLARTDLELDEELNELALELLLAKNPDDVQLQLEQRFGNHSTFDFQVSEEGGAKTFFSQRLTRDSLTVPASVPQDEPVHETLVIPKLGRNRIASQRVRFDAQASPARAPVVIQAIASLKPLEQEMHDLLLVLSTIGPLALIAALAGASILARQALAPVDRMRATAELITAEQLDQRLEVVNSEDELGRLARTLNRMLDRLHGSLAEMRRFTADAAHELRTPLAVLRTEAEVALRAPRSADSYKQVVEVALAETNRLTRLADQLLVLCRQDAGLNPVDQDEDVRVDALLQDVAEQVRAAASQKNIGLVVRDMDACTVRGDDVRLSQLLFNLCDNAIKYTQPGSEISVGCRLRGDRVEIEVQDTGPGIAEEHLPHLFQRFYRVQQSRSRETGGTGLGLAICKAVVESHGGTIRVSSQIGQGTTFTIDLPLSAGASGSMESEVGEAT